MTDLPTAPFRTTTRVRYGETDQMGIVYHANYVSYFEIGRTECMRRSGVTYADMEKEGFRLAVVEISARYVRSARYDEVLTIETRLTDASAVRLRFDYRVLGPPPPDGGDGPLLCEGFTVLACLNEAGRPTRIPSPWRERIEGLSAS
ncbi:MAG: acyl-CoA thioesterase [Planctomycetota bacterium JB042]